MHWERVEQALLAHRVQKAREIILFARASGWFAKTIGIQLPGVWTCVVVAPNIVYIYIYMYKYIYTCIGRQLVACQC